MAKHNTSRWVVAGGTGRTLQPMCRKMLEYLMAHRGEVCKADDIDAAVGTVGVRSQDTMASVIRRALSPEHEQRFITVHRVGYIWAGEPVDIVMTNTPAPAPVIARSRLADTAMTQAEVADYLGISVASVREIEQRALRKLKAKPELFRAWKELLSFKQRATYDPYYELWLFGVGESIARQEEIANPYIEEPTSAE